EHGLPLGVSGSPPDPANRFLTVGPEFFATMQIPIVAGRDFEDRDGPGSPAVAIVNEVFAKANFAGRSPLGQHLILREAGEGERLARDMEIVGVSRSARYGGLTRAIPRWCTCRTTRATRGRIRWSSRCARSATRSGTSSPCAR